MFDENISGELPEHIDFIHNIAIPKFEEWGYKVSILHSDKTYMDCFNHIVTRSKVPERNGKRSGFPMSGKCMINRDCKMRSINKFYKNFPYEYIQYIGIAKDEPKRLERLDENSISLLNKYNITEDDAFKLCEKYGLLSPLYEVTTRGGCWFCPNAKKDELQHLRSKHRDLWNILLKLEDEKDLIGDAWNTRKGISIHDWEKYFSNEERLDNGNIKEIKARSI